MIDKRSPDTPRNDADGDRKRLDDLEIRLRAARGGPEQPRPRSMQREIGFAYRVLIEMAVGIGFGAFAGWWLDRWLGTRPILMVVMILLGFAAGMLNAYRASQAYSAGLRDDRSDDE
ncbi:MAG TPA: AtpZ/AtpI family protein [Alphaproteobacteria bacterium]|nr:AtpZ/AtpI family protein [Alphaproteobacteria bacterium]